MALPKYEGRIQITSAAQTVSIVETGGGGASATVTITSTSTDYYLTSSTSLLTTLANALTNDATLNGTYTCTLDDNSDSSTGKVTISASGITSFTLTWNQTTLRNALGFTGNCTPTASSFTSSSASPYLWLPNTGRANTMGPDGIAGLQVTDATMTMSPSGQSKILQYATRYVDRMEHRFLRGNKAWAVNETASGGVTNESWESFWGTVVKVGQPVRYHADRSDDATYRDYRIMAPHDMSLVSEYPAFVGNSSSPNANTLWHLGPIDLIKFV